MKENIYMDLRGEEEYLLMKNQNMKVNIYIIKNGMEKDLIKMGMLYMN